MADPGSAVAVLGGAARGQHGLRRHKANDDRVRAASSYGRGEEYAADAHGVALLRRAGYSRDMMTDTLTWLMQVPGPDSGGFFATHPGAAERIEAVRKLP